MAKPVHPYQIALDMFFANKEDDGADTVHYLIYTDNKNSLQKWIRPDPKKLKAGEKVEEVVRARINKFTKEKHLHPLHICAMLDRQEMARMLVDTGVCEMNPEDSCKFSPLHHAAVAGFRGMIQLLLDKGADPSRVNDRGGTYAKILELVHFKIDPSRQVCHYKKSKEIACGDGSDFARLTGGAAFLDKEAEMSVIEAVRQWDLALSVTSQMRPQVVDMLRKAYEFFLAKRPILYLEKREGVGLNVCAGEDIEAGAIVTEYLGQDETFNAFQMKRPLSKTYSYAPFEAEKKRGMAALMNDSFPNLHVFEVANLGGLLKRVLFLATTKIPKGSTVCYNYGIAEPVKLGRRQELAHEEMIAYFKQFSSLPAEDLPKLFLGKMHEVLEYTDRMPDPEAYDFFSKLTYLVSTPHAIVEVVCGQVLTIEALTPLCHAMEHYMVMYAKREVGLSKFLTFVQNFSAALKAMKPLKAQQWREKVLASLPKMDVEQLKALMKQAEESVDEPLPKPGAEQEMKVQFVHLHSPESVQKFQELLKQGGGHRTPPPPPKTQEEIEWEELVARCIWKDDF